MSTASGARWGRVVDDLQNPSLGGSPPEHPSGSEIPPGSQLDLARLWHELQSPANRR